MIRTFMAMAAVGLVVVAHPAAQGQGTTGRGPAPAPAPKRPAVTAKTTSARVLIKDPDGAGISGVRLIMSGASTGEFTTGAAGTAILPDLKDGMYRVRCERKGFITLEREFTLHGATWNPIDIVLEPAPPPPPPPPAPTPPPPPVPTMAPGGPAITVSIPDFVDRNYIGREPMKESILACKPLETVRLLQMRESVAMHAHELLNFGSTGERQLDSIAHRKPCLLSHTLYPADYFSCPTFETQGLGDRGIDRGEEPRIFLNDEVSGDRKSVV